MHGTHSFKIHKVLFQRTRTVCPLWSKGKGKGKGKTIPVQGWAEGCRRWRLPDFKTSDTLRW